MGWFERVRWNQGCMSGLKRLRQGVRILILSSFGKTGVILANYDAHVF